MGRGTVEALVALLVIAAVVASVAGGSAIAVVLVPVALLRAFRGRRR